MAAETRLRVIFNQKGGVGKTTLAVNLAACSALRGHRTLLVDSDPQGNASAHLLGKDTRSEKGLATFYENCLGLTLFRPSLLEYVTTRTGVDNLHLVAGSRTLEDLRNKLENKHKIHKLREGLRNSTYEYIVFDPPPANDFFSLACLIAAEEIIIPMDCDAFSLRAARDIVEVIEEVRQDHNPTLRVAGIVVNQFQKGTRHGKEIIAELRELGFPVLEPFIPTSVKVRESHSTARPVVACAPDAPVSKALWELYQGLEGPSDPKRAGAARARDTSSPSPRRREASRAESTQR